MNKEKENLWRESFSYIYIGLAMNDAYSKTNFKKGNKFNRRFDELKKKLSEDWIDKNYESVQQTYKERLMSMFDDKDENQIRMDTCLFEISKHKRIINNYKKFLKIVQKEHSDFKETHKKYNSFYYQTVAFYSILESKINNQIHTSKRSIKHNDKDYAFLVQSR